MIQDECWVDGRVNEALKLEERMKPMTVRVAMQSVDSMKAKVVELIRKHLAKSKSETFLRKPIIVFARTRRIAAALHEYLKEKLEEVKKITLLDDSATLDECLGLERQTVVVTSDEILTTSMDLGFSAVPLMIHYNMPASR